MKKFHYLLLVLLTACTRTEIKERYKNGHKKEVWIYPYSGNNKEHTVILYYPTGERSFQASVENDHFIGKRISYYQNGKVHQIDSSYTPCPVDVEKRNNSGIVKVFTETGWLTKISYYQPHERCTSEEYDSNGVIKKKYEYAHHKINGYYIEYLDSGTARFEGTMVDDTLTGFGVFFDENGDTSKTVWYQNNQISLPYKKWLKDGITLEGYFSKDTTEVTWVWENKEGIIIKRKVQPFNRFVVAPE